MTSLRTSDALDDRRICSKSYANDRSLTLGATRRIVLGMGSSTCAEPGKVNGDNMERFLEGEQSLAAFLDDFGVEIGVVPPEWVGDLERRDMSSAFIWAWCQLGQLYGRSLKLAPVLCLLLGRDDHKGHEDIADTLQNLRDPRSVECLYERATRPLAYLTYNDSTALARKCVWALHDIGTSEAIAKLTLLTRDRRMPVANESSKRLADLADHGRHAIARPYRIARDRKLGSF